MKISSVNWFRHSEKEPQENRPRKPNKSKVKSLWGQEFPLAKRGLDEGHVVAYVEELSGSYDAAMEKLKQVSSPSELATRAILEAERLGETIKQEVRREAAEQASRIIFQAEERAKWITEEADDAAARKLEEARRQSAELVNSFKEKTTLAEREAGLLVPQQVASIQAALRTAIGNAYGEIRRDLESLERQIRATEGEPPASIQTPSPEDVTTGKEHMDGTNGASGPLDGVPLVIELPPETTEIKHLEADLSVQEREPVEFLPSLPKDRTLHMDVGQREKGEAQQESGDSATITGPVGYLPETLKVTPDEIEPSHVEQEQLPAEPLPGGSSMRPGENGAKQNDEDDWNRDDLREMILESLKQATPMPHDDEPEEKPGPSEPAEDHAPNGLDDESHRQGVKLCEGYVELVVPPEKDHQEASTYLAKLSELFMRVKQIPGASILATGGSEAEGNTIAVYFQNPVSLSQMLTGISIWEGDQYPGNGDFHRGSLLGRLKSGKGSESPGKKRVFVTL
ncbi:MAG: hypothetical protein HYX93_05065 [Chloroflexi bacterium]|nr:hypothetical protein [Chloroflexota bacterium]